MEVHQTTHPMVPDGYPTAIVAKLTGVRRSTLEFWDRSGFLSPSVPAKRRGISRQYSFRDLVAIRVARQLKNEGTPLQALRKVVDYLCTCKGLSPSEALAATSLVTDGQDVYEVRGDVSISTLVRPGQRLLLMVPLGAVVAELQAKTRALRAA